MQLRCRRSGLLAGSIHGDAPFVLAEFCAAVDDVADLGVLHFLEALRTDALQGFQQQQTQMNQIFQLDPNIHSFIHHRDLKRSKFRDNVMTQDRRDSRADPSTNIGISRDKIPINRKQTAATRLLPSPFHQRLIINKTIQSIELTTRQFIHMILHINAASFVWISNSIGCDAGSEPRASEERRADWSTQREGRSFALRKVSGSNPAARTFFFPSLIKLLF